MSFSKQAAVLLILSGERDAQKVLLTERAFHLNHHPGEISFPGGMREIEDADLLETALRESEEEVGLKRDDIQLIGSLPPSATRYGVVVTPYVVKMQTIPNYFTVNTSELVSMRWIPTSFFGQDKRVRTDIFSVKGTEYWAPVYQYKNYRIWGVTARLLVSFLNRYSGQNIVRENSAEEFSYPG